MRTNLTVATRPQKPASQNKAARLNGFRVFGVMAEIMRRLRPGPSSVRFARKPPRCLADPAQLLAALDSPSAFASTAAEAAVDAEPASLPSASASTASSLA